MRLVVERALYLAMKIIEVIWSDLTLRTRDTWDSLPFLIVRRTIFISWEIPSLTFLKVNFDGSVVDGVGGVRFMIRALDDCSEWSSTCGHFYT